MKIDLSVNDISNIIYHINTLADESIKEYMMDEIKKKIINTEIENDKDNLERIKFIRENRRFDFTKMNDEIILTKRTILSVDDDIFDIKDIQLEILENKNIDFEYIRLNGNVWNVLELDNRMMKVLLSLNEDILKDDEKIYSIYRFNNVDRRHLNKICILSKDDYNRLIGKRKISRFPLMCDKLYPYDSKIENKEIDEYKLSPIHATERFPWMNDNKSFIDKQ